MKNLQEFLGRAPFVILAALGLLSVFGTFTSLEENIAETLDGWRAVTRPIWDFLLGWIFEHLGLQMTWWFKDYLSLGLISVGMLLRSARHQRRWITMEHAGTTRMLRHVPLYRREVHWWLFPFMFLFWPAGIIVVIDILFPLAPQRFTVDQKRLDKASEAELSDLEKFQASRVNAISAAQFQYRPVFWETGIWFLIIIAINYALIGWFDVSSRPPQIPVWPKVIDV